MSKWIPRIGFSELTAHEIYELGLDNYFRWEGFGVEWLGWAYVLFARPIK